MNKMKTLLPLSLLVAGASFGCTIAGVDDGSPESVASVAQATVYTPVMDSGWTHACAGKSDGTLYCWGYNGVGQVGDGTAGNSRSTPVLVSGVTGAVSVAAGDVHTCAVDSTGSVYCWGDGGSGELGAGAFVSYSTPHLVPSVPGFTNVVQVSAGYRHVCALTSAGGVYCWGNNQYGQLGDGTSTSMQLVPVAVSQLPVAIKSHTTAIGVGANHSCAVVTSGTIGRVYCWGDNTTGQLGNGLTTNSNIPVQVTGITNAVAVTAGTNHTCALLSTGIAQCWGQGTQGQLGDGNTTSSQLTPVTVPGGSRFASIDAGNFFTCAQALNGFAKCWGSNGYSNLGDGTTTQQNSPVVVGVLSDGIGVAAGEGSACALRSGGGVKCWGINNLGNLGNGNTTVTTSVVDVLGFP